MATTGAPAKKAPPKKAQAKKAPVAKRQRRRDTADVARRESCFVMSPFGGWHDQYYSDIYCPAVEDAGLQPHRADDLYLPSAIVHDIWTYVKSARVMLADLTGKNPNVFYELGLAHAVDKPVVLLSQSMEDVPFDLRALRVITYEVEHPSWGELLRGKVTAALQEVLAAPQSAVLHPFQREAPPHTADRDRADDMRSLRREINQLRSELELNPRRLPAARRNVTPEEARRRIIALVDGDVPDEIIVDTLVELGPPLSWIQREIDNVRSARRTEG